MEEQLGALGLDPVRIQAVDGSNPDSLRSAAVASYAPLTGGEIGCFESHRRAWHKVVEEGLPGAFVLEDDAVVASDFGSWAFSDETLANCDLIKLDTSIGTHISWYGEELISLGHSRALRRFLGTEMSTGSYFVTKRGAQRLLRWTRGYYLPIDRVMFTQDSRLFWALDVWKLDPAAAVQMRCWQEESQMPSEIVDSIQKDRTEKSSLWDEAGWIQMARIRLRRLGDIDIRRLRERRIRVQMEAASRSSGAIQAEIPFVSLNTDHIIRAEQLAFGK